jgi:hypothetical protein
MDWITEIQLKTKVKALKDAWLICANKESCPRATSGNQIKLWSKTCRRSGGHNVHRKLPIRLINLFTDEGNPYGRNIQAGLADRID